MHKLIKPLAVALSAAALTILPAGSAVAARADNPVTATSAPAPAPAPAPAALNSTCSSGTYWITEFQMVWGPTASIPPCSFVNVLAYRSSVTDTGWIPWCRSLGGRPVITSPEDVAICYDWFIPSTGQTPIGPPPQDSIVAISELQMVWGPAWFLPNNTWVKIGAYKASGSDAAWIYWCDSLSPIVYISDVGNIGICQVYHFN